MVLGLVLASVSGVTVEQGTLAGFGEAIWMRSRHAEVAVVPRLGRIMWFSRPGGKNVLWTQVVEPKAGEWANWGGDKLWPAPQSNWGWPPPADIDGAPHQAVIQGTMVELRSPVCRRFGVRFTRRMYLSPNRAEFTTVNYMDGQRDATQRLAVWQVAQVDNPDYAELPAQVGKSRFAKGVEAYEGTKLEMPWIEFRGDFARLYRQSAGVAKYGSDGPDGRVSSVRDGVRFTIRTELDPKAEYPDGNKALQVYLSQDPLKYVELELNSPLVDLPPYGQARLTTVWSLQPEGR
jgi:hypothetical protein